MTRMITPILALMLFSLPASAHNLRLFAAQQGNLVEGEAYFAGAGPAAGAHIRLEQEGQQQRQLTTDAQGQFSLMLPGPGIYELVADAGQGHQTRWTLDSLTVTGAAPEPTTTQPTPSETATLAQQLRALQRDLEALRSERRLQDIIGGLGYILGLAGLAAWIMGRRRHLSAD